jgi:hypothetical protein
VHAGRRADARLMSNYQSRLPLTAALLAEVVESGDTFAARKIHWAACEMCESGATAGAWRLLRHAGVSAQRRNAPEIVAALAEEGAFFP